MPKRKPKAPEGAASVLMRARANLRRMDAIVAALPSGTREEVVSKTIAADYVAGDSLSTIAGGLGISPETVRSRLKAVGIPLRVIAFREPAFYHDRARRLREAALALEEVAEIIQGGEIPPHGLLARTTSGA